MSYVQVEDQQRFHVDELEERESIASPVQPDKGPSTNEDRTRRIACTYICIQRIREGHPAPQCEPKSGGCRCISPNSWAHHRTNGTTGQD